MSSNPYQSPLPEGFVDDTIMGYEESLSTHQRVINSLRDRIKVLEAENEGLKQQLVSKPVSGGFRVPQVTGVEFCPTVFGCHMESADID